MCQGQPFITQWRLAIAAHQGISPHTRLVLYTLANYAAADGSRCFPSQKRLAKESGLSERAVRRRLREAQAHGFIEAERRDSTHTKNVYKLFLPSPSTRGSKEPTGHQRPVAVENSQTTGHQRPVPSATSVLCPPATGGLLTSQTRTSQRTRRSYPRFGDRAHALEKPSWEAQQLLTLWGQLLAAHKLNPDVLVGATYEQTSTAMAWTLWRHRATTGTSEPLRNLPGYFAVVLASCKRGEKRLRAYSGQEMRAIAFEGITPAMFFA